VVVMYTMMVFIIKVATLIVEVGTMKVRGFLGNTDLFYNYDKHDQSHEQSWDDDSYYDKSHSRSV